MPPQLFISMQQQQSLTSLKRKEWRIEIRKKQLNDYFQKRRVELINQQHTQTEYRITEEQHTLHILQLINNIALLQLTNLISQIILIDPTLATFYHLTKFNPESTPSLFQKIINETLRGNRRRPFNLQFHLDKQFSNEQRQLLKQVWQKMEILWEQESKKYITLLSAIKRIENQNLLIRGDIIFFLSTILNILLVFQNTANILHIPLTKRTIVGQDTLFRYEIQTTLTQLSNILSGDDELLSPFINDFLDMNGRCIECQGLFYNLFLIKHVQMDVKLKMFQYYQDMINYEREYALENYISITNTLYVAFKSWSCPQFQNKYEKERFLTVGQRFIKFYASLLSVVNMRYQSYTNDEDYIFLNQMSFILFYLGSESLIGCIMESKSFHTFFLNHIHQSKNDIELKVTSTCLQILDIATRDQLSIHYMLNQQPRFVLKFIVLFNKYLEVQYKALSQQGSDVLDNLLNLITSLSAFDKVKTILIQQKIIHKIKDFYFRINGQSRKEKNIKINCEITFLNLLAYLKSLQDNLESFYKCLFQEGTSYEMLINILKYTQRRSNLVYQAIKYLSYIAYSCDTSPHFSEIKEMLMSPILTSRLTELQNCQNTNISQKATYIINTIKSLKYINHPSIHHSEYYQEEDLI